MSKGTLPGTTNLITNPSAESGTSGWTTQADAGITNSLSDVTETSWVGAKSFRMTATANTGAANATFGMFTAMIAATAGLPYAISCRTKIADVDLHGYIMLRFYNVGGTTLASTFEVENTAQPIDQWIKHSVSAVAPVGTTQMRMFVLARQEVSNQVGIQLWADGIQLEQHDNSTPYCDGDQPGCFWNGTAHASSSTRDATDVQKGTTGKYGIIKLLPELFIANKSNVLQTNISDWIISGNVALDTDADVQMTFSARILYPDRLDTFVDFLAPYLTIVYADGTFRKEQVGLFAVTPMRKTYTFHDTVGEIDGRDLTWLLAQQAFEKTYSMKTGRVFVEVVREIIEGAGFTRHSIRNSTRVSGRSRSWPPGTSKLEIINELLTATGMYKLFCDRRGVFTSFPFIDINTAHVSGTYRSGDDSFTVEPLTLTPSLDSLANHILVIKDDAEAKPSEVIRAVRKNTNTASPTSIPNIGLIFKVVRDSTLADQDAADELADKLRNEWSNIYVEGNLHTFPEPWHDPHEVYELDLQQRERFWKYWDNGLFIDLSTGKRHKGKLLPDGSWANPDYKTPAANELRGRYLCKGWRLSFTPEEAAQTGGMEHTISRIVEFGNEVT